MFLRKIFAAIVVFALAGVADLARAADVCSEPVATAAGQVRGTTDTENTCVWRGIPYAAPPIGELRWKAPRPAAKFSGVREAVKFGDRCMQGAGLLSGGAPEGIGMSEDCLNLNIWRPAAPAPLPAGYPVMVWIHGGGYYTGGGADPSSWSDRLAAAGKVIVVTINYRLDIFGFMAHPKLRTEDPNNSTGGYGTMDQAFALNWVHDNIAGFGGDPGNVTIFGQSAGGASICTMIATPLAKGTFQRAIMQSGLCELSEAPEAAYELTRAKMKLVGCAFDDLDCMRRLPAAKLIKEAASEITDGFVYMPLHDGHILTGTPLSMIRAGNYNRVDIMAGTVKDEFAAMLKLAPKYYFVRPAAYESTLLKQFKMTKEQADRFVVLYPLFNYGGRPVVALGRGFGADAVMQCPAHRGLLALLAGGGNAWFYRFEYDDQKMGKTMGSYHSAELPFIWNSFDRPPATTFYKGMDLVKEKELSRIMIAYWTNFARSGNPNGAGVPEWKPFQADAQTIQILDAGTVENRPAASEAERCEFWDGYTTDFVPMANELIGSIF
jgi:para-nitrobenzyl esterase